MTQVLHTKIVMKMVVKTPPEHICLHEEQIQGQSRAIERLDAELEYKKERLDELKEDNKRMEEKIDDIKDCVNELILKSKTDDEILDKRILALETRQKVQNEMIEKNRADNNLKLYVVIVIFTALTFYFNFVKGT